MKKLAVLISIIVVAGLIAASGVFAKGMGCACDARGVCVPTCTMAKSGNCDSAKACKMPASVSGANINDTPSIKEMQSKACPAMCYKTDSLGNRVASRTDNSGKNYLGR